MICSTIEQVDDFKIFCASERAMRCSAPLIESSAQANQEFIETRSIQAPKMPITGSFVYAHAPNYRGRPMNNAGYSGWMQALGCLVDLGIDTIILQASLWNELNECDYPSKAFANMKFFDVVDPLLKAAKSHGLTVFLGGYGSLTGWKEQLSAEDINGEDSRQTLCFKELIARYRGQFSGFYFMPETAFHGERDIDKEEKLNQLYRGFCGTIKSMAPELAILMSPATFFHPGKTADMIAAWNHILSRVPLDIMAPQDSIGCCVNTLSHQEETFAAWNEICIKNGLTFWSNVEVFQRYGDVRSINHSIPASPERIAFQINHASKFVSKLIAWELLYYQSDDCGEAGRRLAEFLRFNKHDKKQK